MTLPEMLLDLKAAHAARTQYRASSERFGELALRLRDVRDPRSRSAAFWANWIRRKGGEEAS